MATERQAAALAKARMQAQANREAKAAEKARAAEATTIIEEYVADAHEEGIEEPLPPVRMEPKRQSPRFRAMQQPEKPLVTPYSPTENIRKIVLTAGQGSHHFILDLEEGTWESRSNNMRGALILRGTGPVLRIDADNLRKSQFGHIEQDGIFTEMTITRYDRVRDIEEFVSSIQETRSAYDSYVDENSLFEDEDDSVALTLEEDPSDLEIDLGAEEDTSGLPDVSLATFYGETDDTPITSDDGDDEGDLIDPELLDAMNEADADLVDVRELQDDTDDEDDGTDDSPFTDDEEEDDGEYFDSTANKGKAPAQAR
jgi:hypothetical protein